MSYMVFTQQCKDCKATWNAAFGVIHTMIIQTRQEFCPKCGSGNLTRIDDGWDTTWRGAQIILSEGD